MFGAFHNRFDKQKSKALVVSEYFALALAAIPLVVTILTPVWVLLYCWFG